MALQVIRLGFIEVSVHLALSSLRLVVFLWTLRRCEYLGHTLFLATLVWAVHMPIFVQAQVSSPWAAAVVPQPP